MSYPVLTRARCSFLTLPNAVQCQDQLRHYLFRMDHHSVFKHTCAVAEKTKTNPKTKTIKTFSKTKNTKKHGNKISQYNLLLLVQINIMTQLLVFLTLCLWICH